MSIETNGKILCEVLHLRFRKRSRAALDSVLDVGAFQYALDLYGGCYNIILVSSSFRSS